MTTLLLEYKRGGHAFVLLFNLETIVLTLTAIDNWYRDGLISGHDSCCLADAVERLAETQMQMPSDVGMRRGNRV